MACALTGGMTLDCRDAIGGITTVYIVESASLLATGITASSGTITAISMVGGAKFYTFNFKDETGQFTDELMTSDPNGTVFSEQNLTFPTFKMSASKRNLIKLLSQNQLKIMITDNNGVTWLMGEAVGATLQNTKGDSGKLRGDMNGYNLAFKAREANQAQVVTPGIIAAIVQ